MIPNDPVILLSFVNARLRDEYDSLEELCGALDVSRPDLEERLAAIYDWLCAHVENDS
ncbi:MAG: DUF4250 domain-containing protein, partial [Clostridiales bacterium]|nr:DUF4250 domain-containing protein [Clostridiales bacterium]